MPASPHGRWVTRPPPPGSAAPAGGGRHCVGGWETLREEQQNSGYSVEGTVTEHTLVPAAFATPAVTPRHGDAVSGLDTGEHIANLVDAVDNELTARRTGLNSYLR